jgi:hypothetical protein
LNSLLNIQSDISFELTRVDESIYLGIQGEEFFFPSPDEGRFRFLISQSSQADLRIRLDSAGAANAPGEFVEKVLGELPGNGDREDGTPLDRLPGSEADDPPEENPGGTSASSAEETPE